MGLILDARSSLFLPESIAYWKAVTVTKDGNTNSRSSLKVCSFPKFAVAEARSKELASSLFNMMNTNNRVKH